MQGKGAQRSIRVGSDGGSAGFTVIEVVLFLAISAALMIALLSTIGLTIARQRFTDSIVGTQAYVQSGFNEALNVQSDRSGRSCTVGTGNETILGDGTTPRGASASCVVLGRALVFTKDSPRITSYPVIGNEPANPGTVSGAELLLKYAPVVDTGDPAIFDIPWDASPVDTIRRAGTDSHASTLYLLRSPDSGLILVYSGDSPQAALGEGTGTFTFCLRSADITQAVTGLTIAPVAGSESVTTAPDLNGDQRAEVC